jgi:hypothetical protein
MEVASQIGGRAEFTMRLLRHSLSRRIERGMKREYGRVRHMGVNAGLAAKVGF